MNLNKLGSYVQEIEEILSKIKALTIASDKVQIATVRDEKMSYLHYWDPRNEEPRVLCSVPFELELKKFVAVAQTALNKLSPFAAQVGVQWIGDLDWKELPEGFQKLDQIFSIEKKELSEEQKEYIRGTQYALYNLSSELPVQGSDRGDVQQDRTT